MRYKPWRVVNHGGVAIAQENNSPLSGTDHKALVARSLREGLQKIRAFCWAQFLTNPLNEQWQYLERKHSCDIDWHDNKVLVEDNFAWKSKRLLRRLQGD